MRVFPQVLLVGYRHKRLCFGRGVEGRVDCLMFEEIETKEKDVVANQFDLYALIGMQKQEELVVLTLLDVFGYFEHNLVS